MITTMHKFLPASAAISCSVAVGFFVPANASEDAQTSDLAYFISHHATDDSRGVCEQIFAAHGKSVGFEEFFAAQVASGAARQGCFSKFSVPEHSLATLDLFEKQYLLKYLDNESFFKTDTLLALFIKNNLADSDFGQWIRTDLIIKTAAMAALFEDIARESDLAASRCGNVAEKDAVLLREYEKARKAKLSGIAPRGWLLERFVSKLCLIEHPALARVIFEQSGIKTKDMGTLSEICQAFAHRGKHVSHDWLKYAEVFERTESSPNLPKFENVLPPDYVRFETASFPNPVFIGKSPSAEIAKLFITRQFNKDEFFDFCVKNFGKPTNAFDYFGAESTLFRLVMSDSQAHSFYPKGSGHSAKEEFELRAEFFATALKKYRGREAVGALKEAVIDTTCAYQTACENSATPREREQLLRSEIECVYDYIEQLTYAQFLNEFKLSEFAIALVLAFPQDVDRALDIYEKSSIAQKTSLGKLSDIYAQHLKTVGKPSARRQDLLARLQAADARRATAKKNAWIKTKKKTETELAIGTDVSR